MKIKINKILCFSAIIFSWTLQAQFNTLRNESISEENVFEIKEETLDIQKEQGEENQGNWLTNLFKGKNKKKDEELKKEIDSLKIQIERNKSGIESKLKEIKELIVVDKKEKEIDDSMQKKESESLKVHLPLKRLEITSKYGNRIHPISGKFQKHEGIDLRAVNENVFSVLNGEIIDVGFDEKGGGNYVKIKHFNKDIETAYLHLSKVLCKVGDVIKCGDIIGISGESGNVTAPHLHFSVKINGEYKNPLKFLSSLVKLKFNI